MTRLPSPEPRMDVHVIKPKMNVYTALAFVATVVVILGLYLINSKADLLIDGGLFNSASSSVKSSSR